MRCKVDGVDRMLRQRREWGGEGLGYFSDSESSDDSSFGLSTLDGNVRSHE